MTREEYIGFRNKNASNPFYEYYKEKYKGDNPLSVGDFFQAMSMWPHSNQAYQRVIQEYDVQHEIVAISNVKTGQILKFI